MSVAPFLNADPEPIEPGMSVYYIGPIISVVGVALPDDSESVMLVGKAGTTLTEFENVLHYEAPDEFRTYRFFIDEIEWATGPGDVTIVPIYPTTTEAK